MSTFDVIPLGGIREIGKNMWVVSNQQHMIVVDVGLKFPSEDMYGVNHLLPEFTYLVENKDKLAGIVLTHAHEDHVGGLVPLIKALGFCPPIYASELTLGLLEERICEIDATYREQLHPIQGRTEIQIETLKVRFMHVCHSISGAIGLAVDTPKGAIIFTGDFKMDPTPIDQQPTDYFSFADLGEKGVLLLISDSTNATNPGYTISEKEVAQNFTNVFYRAKGRIIIATFASSLHRIQQIVNRCVEFDRKIAFVGRSMERMTAKAIEMGYLTAPAGQIITADAIDGHAPNKVAILTTGSQGEPLAALSLMASGRYRQISIQPGDTVIISATPIPGNERSVFQNVNLLMARGAEVIYESRKGLHASGHASQEELKLMLNLTKPRYFIPTHGEYRQMVGHAHLAMATGMARENVYLLDIGDRFQLIGDQASVGPKVAAGVVMVAGNGAGYLDGKELRERHKMVKDGVIFVSCAFDAGGRMVGLPRLVSKGFIVEEDPAALYKEAAQHLLQSFEGKEPKKLTSSDLENSVQSRLSHFIHQKTQRRPVIVPLVHPPGEETPDV